MQDDKDRENIGLLGMQTEAEIKSPKPSDKQIISGHTHLLKPSKSCLNCQGNSQRDKASIMKTFKMACLHY
jgi:hypothetical protein